jgi:hypothetical protein
MPGGGSVFGGYEAALLVVVPAQLFADGFDTAGTGPWSDVAQ